MKTKTLFILILGFLVLSIGVPAYSWQGRMGGMGDPFGLVEDESDFLIHPSKIAIGEGTKFYGDYRFNYRGVLDWNYNINTLITPPGIILWDFPFKGSGDEYGHNGLLGMAFPVGPGRMGLFFQYAGRRGDYDGKENVTVSGTPFAFNKYNLESDLDSFALRILYGLPVGGFKLGGEIQFSYRNEENTTRMSAQIDAPLPVLLINNPFSIGLFPPSFPPHSTDLFPFMIPYDSNYLEALFKGSLEGSIGPAKIAFTMRGGIIFGGDNQYKFVGSQLIPNAGGAKLNGDVKGWNIGGDLWLRYALGEGLSLPFVVKAGYQKKTRDGDGQGWGGFFMPFGFDYKNKEKNFQIEAGGGVDKELGKGMRVAAGIYYNYSNNKNDFSINVSPPGTGPIWFHDYTNYPDHTEHQVILRLAVEKNMSSMVAMRMGLNFFYGWVTKEDFKFNYSEPGFSSTDVMPLDGDRWGIGVSLGATVKFTGFTLEPFLGGGYQKLKLSGDGSSTGPFFPSPPFSLGMDMLKKEWLMGGGFSIKF
jgi:hypothetical protein